MNTRDALPGTWLIDLLHKWPLSWLEATLVLVGSIEKRTSDTCLDWKRPLSWLEVLKKEHTASLVESLYYWLESCRKAAPSRKQN
jgi:hypothetical protein